jgi:branched-chain amino acid aminotransferase
MVSRGLKSTPYQNPKVTVGKPTMVILPEWKEAAPGELYAAVNCCV